MRLCQCIISISQQDLKGGIIISFKFIIIRFYALIIIQTMKKYTIYNIYIYRYIPLYGFNNLLNDLLYPLLIHNMIYFHIATFKSNFGKGHQIGVYFTSKVENVYNYLSYHETNIIVYYIIHTTNTFTKNMKLKSHT